MSSTGTWAAEVQRREDPNWQPSDGPGVLLSDVSIHDLIERVMDTLAELYRRRSEHQSLLLRLAITEHIHNVRLAIKYPLLPSPETELSVLALRAVLDQERQDADISAKEATL